MKYIIAVILFVMTLDASATNITGTINSLSVGRLGDQIFVDLDTNVPNICGTPHPNGFEYAFLISENDAAAEIVGALMLAYNSGKSVTIVGLNVCTIDTRVEDMSYVILR